MSSSDSQLPEIDEKLLRGQIHKFHFEIKKDHINDFVWPRYGSPTAGKLPERKPSGEEETKEEG